MSNVPLSLSGSLSGTPSRSLSNMSIPLPLVTLSGLGIGTLAWFASKHYYQRQNAASESSQQYPPTAAALIATPAISTSTSASSSTSASISATSSSSASLSTSTSASISTSSSSTSTSDATSPSMTSASTSTSSSSTAPSPSLSKPAATSSPIQQDVTFDVGDVDETDSASRRRRHLSQLELESIRLSLAESLHKLFACVDEDGDGYITKPQFSDFLNKLGLTGEREEALVNILAKQRSMTNKWKSSSQQPPPHGNHTTRVNQENRITYQQFLAAFETTLAYEHKHGKRKTKTRKYSTLPVPGTKPVPSSSTTSSTSSTTSSTSTSSTSSSASINIAPSTTSTSVPPTHHHTQSASFVSINPSAPSTSTFSQVASSPTHNSASTSPSFPPRPPSASPPDIDASSIHVFLGGACGASQWRSRAAIPKLAQHGISYYDPQVKDWDPNLIILENLMKAWCKVLLFVINSRTRSLASMIEAAQLIAEGRNVVLVIKDVPVGADMGAGHLVSASEAKDLNRARRYLADIASQYSVHVYTSVESAVDFIISEYHESRNAPPRPFSPSPFDSRGASPPESPIMRGTTLLNRSATPTRTRTSSSSSLPHIPPRGRSPIPSASASNSRTHSRTPSCDPSSRREIMNGRISPGPSPTKTSPSKDSPSRRARRFSAGLTGMQIPTLPTIAAATCPSPTTPRAGATQSMLLQLASPPQSTRGSPRKQMDQHSTNNTDTSEA